MSEGMEGNILDKMSALIIGGKPPLAKISEWGYTQIGSIRLEDLPANLSRYPVDVDLIFIGTSEVDLLWPWPSSQWNSRRVFIGLKFPRPGVIKTTPSNLRVGRVIYSGWKKILPAIEGWTTILVLSIGSEYWDLSPFFLKDEQGRLMENVWQFSKIYQEIPSINEKKWSYPAEKHLDEKGAILPEYWRWRHRGMTFQKPIRYPVGWKHRHNVVATLCNPQDVDPSKPPSLEIMGYVEARRKLYVPLYTRLLKQKPRFQQLRERFLRGERMLIVEVDGPHLESLGYYKKMYPVYPWDDWFEGETIDINPGSIHVLLSDTRHPFGHGYCMAMALLDWA